MLDAAPIRREVAGVADRPTLDGVSRWRGVLRSLCGFLIGQRHSLSRNPLVAGPKTDLARGPVVPAKHALYPVAETHVASMDAINVHGNVSAVPLYPRYAPTKGCPP